MSARLCVLGAGGRMGRQVLEVAAADDSVAIAAAADRAGSAEIGREVAPGVRVTDDVAAAVAAAEVYIDFSAPEATAAAARAAASTGTAAVVGTTGLGADAEAALEALAARAPVLVAPNFSLGVNLLIALAETAARALGPDYDLEVVETHHRRKRDAPSGTALALAEALARGRELDLAKHRVSARDGLVGERTEGEIGVMALRGGDVIGEHTAFFFGADERVELTHRASSRALFARGAVRAAAWLAGKAPGRYQMRDVLGL